MACDKICSKCGETGLGCSCGGCKKAFYMNNQTYCEKCFNEVFSQSNGNQGKFGIKITGAYGEIINKKDTNERL